MGHTLCSPFEQTHRVALGLKQAFQIGQQGLIYGCDLLPPTTIPAYPTSRFIDLSCLQFLQPLVDCLTSDPCLARHSAYPSSPYPLGLCRHIQPPLSLIEHSTHHFVLIFLREIYHSLSLSHLFQFAYFISACLLSTVLGGYVFRAEEAQQDLLGGAVVFGVGFHAGALEILDSVGSVSYTHLRAHETRHD